MSCRCPEESHVFDITNWIAGRVFRILEEYTHIRSSKICLTIRSDTTHNSRNRIEAEVQKSYQPSSKLYRTEAEDRDSPQSVSIGVTFCIFLQKSGRPSLPSLVTYLSSYQGQLNKSWPTLLRSKGSAQESLIPIWNRTACPTRPWLSF